MYRLAWKMSLILMALLAMSLVVVACAGDDDDDDNDDDDTAADDDDDTSDSDDDDDDNDDDDDSLPPRDDGSFTDDPTPFVSDLDARTDQYLLRCAEGTGLYNQVCRLALNSGPLHADAIDSSLRKMDNREDCADFRLQSIARILAKYPDHPEFTPFYDEVMESVQNFKYWIDEPGVDGMCYWSENHQILFNSSAFIIGGLYPEMVFTNSGFTGQELRDRARERIIIWLDYRLKWGFSEFHSNVYYNEDGAPVVNLIDFADDEEIQTKATMVMDLLLYDMALGNHDGLFGMPHGRSYMKDKQSLEKEDTRGIMWLAFGKGPSETHFGSMTAIAMADSDYYRVPAVIESVGSARPRGLVSRQRIGIDVMDGPAKGISWDEYDDVMFYWGMGAYAQYQVVEGTLNMANDYGLFEGEGFFSAFSIAYPVRGIAPWLLSDLNPLVNGFALETANSYVYRTPETMLSSVQDWKPATLGAQTHAWQASLDGEALAFTTYPGDLADDSFAGHWTGGFHPRVGQYRTAAIILYDLPTFENPLYTDLIDSMFPKYTHAFFPMEAFDEVIQEAGWTFGKKGDGFIGLYSKNPTTWETEGEWGGKELRAEGVPAVWICEVGDTELYESFEEFVTLVSSAAIEDDGMYHILYESPGQGVMQYSWAGPLSVNGIVVQQAGFPRFDSPYALKEYEGADPFVIERGGLSLTIDPVNMTREVVE